MGVVLHRLDKQRQSEQLAEMLRCDNESHHHFCPNFCPHALLSSSSLSSSSSSSSPAFWSSRVTMLTVEASNLESVELSHYNHRQFWQFSELILFFFRPDNVTNMLDQFGMAPFLAAQVDYWTNSKKNISLINKISRVCGFFNKKWCASSMVGCCRNVVEITVLC